MDHPRRGAEGGAGDPAVAADGTQQDLVGKAGPQLPQHGGAGGRVSGADGGRLGQHHQRFPQPLDEAAEPGGGIPRQPERLVPGRLGTLGAQLDLRCHQQ